MFVLVDVATNSQFGLREDVPLYIGERKNAATSHLFCNHTECIKCAKVVVKNSNAYITDMGSRHRTSVIGVVLPPLEEKQLIPGNSFCIGKNRDRLLLQYISLTVTCSGFGIGGSRSLEELLGKQGARVVKDWGPDVTHVLATGDILTKKVVCGLIAQQFVVGPEFFHSRWRAITEGEPLPDADKYKVRNYGYQCPLQVNHSCDRKRLFANKIAIFDDSALKRSYGDIIEMCGGEVRTLDDGDIIAEDFRGERDIMVFVTGGLVKSGRKRRLMEIVKSLGRRCIPVQEIATAVLSGNTEFFCNSKHLMMDTLRNAQKLTSMGDELVDDTQSTTGSQSRKRRNPSTAGSSMYTENPIPSSTSAGVRVQPSQPPEPLPQWAKDMLGIRDPGDPEPEPKPSTSTQSPVTRLKGLKRRRASGDTETPPTALLKSLSVEPEKPQPAPPTPPPLPELPLSSTNLKLKQSAKGCKHPQPRQAKTSEDSKENIPFASTHPFSHNQQQLHTSSPGTKLTLKRKNKVDDGSTSVQKRPNLAATIPSFPAAPEPSKPSIHEIQSPSKPCDGTKQKKFRKQNLVKTMIPKVTMRRVVTNSNSG